MDLVFNRTKKIPTSRFGRQCSLCGSCHGVPIECSARGCKEAYHTTCAIRGKLKMQAIFGRSFKGGIKLRSYCREHSPAVDLENGNMSAQADKIDANGVKEIDMTNLADDRLQEANEELDYFWKYVDINDVQKKISEMYARQRECKSELRHNECSDKESSPKKAKNHSLKTADSSPKKTGSPKKVKIKHDEGSNSAMGLNSSADEPLSQETDPLVIDLIYRYWMLLRTANNGQSLIKFSPSALKEREFEQRKSIMKLRIELERVRNLSYMIGKREKLKASWLKTHQNIIKRTFSIINDLKPVSDAMPMIESSGSSDVTSHTNHNRISSNHPHLINNHNTHTTNNKKSLHQTQHLMPTNGMFDESVQLINDLISCDQIYELPNSSTNSNYDNLSYQERSTLERRRTLSLVRRINRQLKNISVKSESNPYRKSYLATKRSDSPTGVGHTVTAKVIR
uniref:PHD finger protein rhinoceros n=1 Tax=Aceria tosichella TaxID=561515 RepID=A0A6G1SK90_9ACAR